MFAHRGKYGGREDERRHALIPLLRTHRLIEHVECFVPETMAAKTLAATNKIGTKVTILAVLETFRERALVCIDAIETFVAKFTFMDERAINAVVAEFADIAIQIILSVVAIDAQITIFQAGTVRAVC